MSSFTSVNSNGPGTSSFRPVVGGRVDARDALGKWLPATIIQIEEYTPRRSGTTRSPLSPSGDWENDAVGQWQPRGGKTVKIHFEGFADKWDEWIHIACYLPNLSTILTPPLRPRLAPYHLLTAPVTSSSHRFQAGDTVEVEVHIPIELADVNSHQPSFQIHWLPAIVLKVDYDQLHIRYEPPAPVNHSFRYPVWFHVALGEVKRFGHARPTKPTQRLNNTTIRPISTTPITAATTRRPNVLTQSTHTVPGPEDEDLSTSNITSAAQRRREQERNVKDGKDRVGTTTATASTVSNSTPSSSTTATSNGSANGTRAGYIEPSLLQMDGTAATRSIKQQQPSPYVSPTSSRAVVNHPPPVAASSASVTTSPAASKTGFLSSLANLSLLPSSNPYAVGKLCDVRSMDDGLWSEAKVIDSKPEFLTVQLTDRSTTQLVEPQDQPYMLAPYQKYSSGSVSPRYELGDAVEAVLNAPDHYPIHGKIKRFKQGQMLIWNHNLDEGFWVNPTFDTVVRVADKQNGTHSTPSTNSASSTVPLTRDESKMDSDSPVPSTFSKLKTMFSFGNNDSTATTTPSSSSTSSTTAMTLNNTAASSSTSTDLPPNPYPAIYAALVHRSLEAQLRARVGIVNLGNSCYISAGLQCLAALSPLIQYFVLDRTHESILEDRITAASTKTRSQNNNTTVRSTLPPNFGKLTMEFSKFLSELYDGSSGPRIWPDDLKRAVVNLENDAGARFRGVQMQDAHEFLAVLLNGLHHELNTGVPPTTKKMEPTKSNTTLEPPPQIDPAISSQQHWNEFQRTNTDPISHLFYCQATQYVICSSCNYASCSHHVIGQFTLDIPHLGPKPTAASRLYSSVYRSPTSIRSQTVTLNQCLATQLAVAELDDYLCSSCHSKHPAESSMYFTTLPHVLLIQLKRFDPVVGIGGGIKDETPCDYPLILDVAHLLQPHVRLMKNLHQVPFTLDPKTTATKYRLIGVVLHSAHHYTALTQVRPEERSSTLGRPYHTSPPPKTQSSSSGGGSGVWCYFNDSKTSLESVEDVLGQQKDVYLLMYQQINEEEGP